MQNRKFIILFVLVLSIFCKISQAQNTEVVLAYIARYKDLAIAEMQRTGVPASITLAQGIHETSAGTSVLVTKSNNHFGIKCKANWVGQSVSHDDDARGECFRKYDAPEDSYRDHSDFLRNGTRYAPLFALDPTDYEGWCYGLKKAGYATNPKYSQVLIKLIRDYNLQDYTMIAMGKMKPEELVARNEVIAAKSTETTETPVITTAETREIEQPVVTMNYPASGEFRINATRVVFVKKGTSFLNVAQDYELPLARLYEFNDMKEQEVASCDQLIFIQRKRKTGETEFHVVQRGETMYSIAQSEGIRLESLQEYNGLSAGMEPATGETLSLKMRSASRPKLVSETKINNDNLTQTVAYNTKTTDKINPSRENEFVIHKVKPKETIYSIARKYNVSYGEVVEWNRLTQHSIKIGQSLKIYR